MNNPAADSLIDIDLDQFRSFRVGNVNRTGNARVEGVNGPQDFDRLLWIGQHMIVLQGCFICSRLSLRVARPGIPGAWNHGLIIADPAIVNDNPV